MIEINVKPILISELEAYYQGFLEFKRAIGQKYTGDERALKYFARYCRDKYTDDCIPEDAIYEWINEDDNRSMKTKSNYSGVMTAWAKYMFSLGYMQMRIPDIRCPRNTAFVPHIFTASEMEAIWSSRSNRMPSKRFRRYKTFSIMICFPLCTGAQAQGASFPRPVHGDFLS